jgi:hypothetical protein
MPHGSLTAPPPLVGGDRLCLGEAGKLGLVLREVLEDDGGEVSVLAVSDAILAEYGENKVETLHVKVRAPSASSANAARRGRSSLPWRSG